MTNAGQPTGGADPDTPPCRMPPSTTRQLGTSAVSYREAGQGESARANRRWWDADARAYLAEHAGFLGEADFVWCPEGLREADARLLGEVAGRRVLEVGCGSAPCSRWLVRQGATPIGLDLSAAMLSAAAETGHRLAAEIPLLQADACALPLADGCLDLACSAFGAVPFVADSAGLMAEVARVLRPGGRWVFSVTHPMRWIFPDDPGPQGLRVTSSYFDRRAYVETDDSGVATYIEHHRTMADRLTEIADAGLLLDGLVEPEWPQGLEATWGQWSPRRGALFPGTAIFRTRKPG